MDNTFEQFANISKAQGYDILSKQFGELKEECEKIKDYVSYVEDKIECGEFPLTYKEWITCENDLKEYDTI